MRKSLGVIFALILSHAIGFAEGATLPPGKWWRHARVIQHLSLSDEQQSRLDTIFRGNASDLIDLKADVEKRSLVLRSEMEQPQVDRQAVQRAAANLSAARARLFERELMMFVDMRGVLSPDQWSRFRHVLDARETMRRDGPMRHGPGRADRGPGRPDRGPGRPDRSRPQTPRTPPPGRP